MGEKVDAWESDEEAGSGIRTRQMAGEESDEEEAKERGRKRQTKVVRGKRKKP